MSNFKKLLSMLLAIVMICSTLAIGAQAAYSDYKDEAITGYDSIDQPIFTAAQLASLALDAIDGLLADLDETSIKVPVINVTINYSSIDAALASLENIYNGTAWATIVNIAGDLGNLEFKSLNTDKNSKNFAAEGCRRTTPGKTDLDVLYSIFNFIGDNAALLASYGYGTLNLGATLTGILEGFLPEISAYLDAPNLIKGLLYDAVYDPDDENGYPEWDELSAAQKASAQYSADAMVQKLVDDQMDDLEASLGRSFDWGISMELSGILDIDAASFYDVFEAALQRAYNEILVPLGNTKFKKFFYEFAGVEDFEAYKITKTVVDEETGETSLETIGYYLDDCSDIIKLKTSEYNFPAGNSLAEDVAAGNVELNVLGEMINLDYEIQDYDFANSATKELISEFNNILGSWLKDISKFDAAWESGSNDQILPNLMGLVREFLKEYGDAYLSEYITIPSDAEIDELQTLTDVVLKFGPGLIEQFAPNIILPANVTTVRAIVTYALCELIADKVPEEDIYAKLQSGAIDPNGDEGWKAVAAVIARYYLNSLVNVDIPAGLTFDQTITHIVDWALKNYGGILNYASDLSSNTSLSAWEKLDQVIFGLIPLNWLPETARVLDASGKETSIAITGSEVLILDIILGNALDLKIEYFLDLLKRHPGGELDSSPVNVILGTVRRILNAIIPGAMPIAYPTIESILTPQSLGGVINGLLSGLKTISTDLLPAALPLVGMILELTTEQTLEDPTVTYPDLIIDSARSLNGTAITVRNSSTGVNTAWTDANGKTTQDDLYKVVIKSIKSDNSAVAITYNAGLVLNGGESATFPVTGKLSADGLVAFTVAYEILNELGKSLTDEPIEVRFYTYVSATHADDDESYYDYDQYDLPLYYVDGSGINNHFIISAPVSYVTSWGALGDQNFTIGRDSAEGNYMPNDAAVTFKGFTTDMPADVILAPDFENFTTGQGGYFGDKDLYKLNIPQVTNDAGEPVDMSFEDAYQWLIDNGYGSTFNANLTLTFGATMGSGSLDYTVNRKVVLYKDYGLYGLVGSAMDANRQKSNYATSGTFQYTEKTTNAAGETVETTYTANAATAWNNYIAALDAAQAIVLKPKTINTFDASVYEAAAANLKRAAADLDACAVSAGVGALEALKEQYNPSNPEGMEYDDPAYNYMGSEDYVLYTWDRYKEHRDNLNSLIDSQYVDEPGENATEEEWNAYYAAVDAIPTLKQFDITYRGHMYEMNAQRLVRRAASKNYLTHAYRLVANNAAALNPDDYSDESWAALERAMAFADVVLADNSADLRQTKVNEARHQLIAAYKGLSDKGSDPADYAQLDEYIAEAEEIFNTENYEELYVGLEDLQAAYDEAVAVSRDLLADDQATVDEAAAALRNALDALERVEAGLDFTPAEGVLADNGFEWAPSVKDGYGDEGDFQYIDGLMLECGYDIYELIGTTGGASYDYYENANNAGQLGTGDYIELDDGTVYYIVLYADINGDGTVEGADISQLDLLISGDLYDSFGIQNLAADVNCDGGIDGFDSQTISMMISGDVDYYSYPQDGSGS